jgi:hypothetical protein
MKDNALKKENCKNTIPLNALSLMAEYISDGTWVVVTNTPLRMTIDCESISDNKEIIIKPPVDLLRLNTSCSANETQEGINDLGSGSIEISSTLFSSDIKESVDILSIADSSFGKSL